MVRQIEEENALLPGFSRSLPASLTVSLMLFPSNAFKILCIRGASGCVCEVLLVCRSGIILCWLGRAQFMLDNKKKIYPRMEYTLLSACSCSLLLKIVGDV